MLGGQVDDYVFWQVRFPRVIGAFLVGGGLSLAGLLAQSLIRNPLAEPYLLGTSSGASFGAALAMTILPVNYLGLSSVTLAAFFGSLLALGVVWTLCYRRWGWSPIYLILIGLLTSLFFSSATTLLVISSSTEAVRGILFWLLGSLSQLSLQEVFWLFLIEIVVVLGVLYYGKEIDLLNLTDEEIASLGGDLKKVRMGLFLTTALLTSVLVSLAGVIGFVGLLIPHATRMMGLGFVRTRSLACLLLGGGSLVAVDTISRMMMAPAETPIGLWTGLLGAPLFIWFLYRQGAYRVG